MSSDAVEEEVTSAKTTIAVKAATTMMHSMKKTSHSGMLQKACCFFFLAKRSASASSAIRLFISAMWRIVELVYPSMLTLAEAAAEEAPCVALRFVVLFVVVPP